MRSFWVLLLAIVIFACRQTAGLCDEAGGVSFFRGLNLNGPPVTIDTHQWEGSDANWYESNDKAFDNESVKLVPATDSERAKMIRSSRWGGNRVDIRDMPQGEFTVFLYVWEDNNSETYSIFLNGALVEKDFQSGTAGSWKKLGPWYTRSQDGQIVLTSKGGAANFSGIEIWKGHYDGVEQPISEEQLAFFEKRIRPLLVDRCYSCHSKDSEELQGDFLVDSRAPMRRGGLKGPGIIPGAPDKSLVIQAVRFEDESLQMPPDDRLSDEQIADLEKWVAMGAPDPRAGITRHEGKKIDLESARQFWSFRPIVDPPKPAIKQKDWPKNSIDDFVLNKMESMGIEPAPDAERRLLIRRVTYDLIGLPPSPNEVDSFLQDSSADALSKLVDRLLESPQYGERWGRHWLDIVRYADTAGDNSDYPIPQMYRYRNWVIDAFNRDLPYDEFIRDQLAGDLRGGDTEVQRQDRLIATGYIANSRRFGSRVDDYPQHLTIEDTLDNVGRAFLGLSLSCARCHDHKFDPITTRDYYGLYGIFQSTRYPWPGIELDKRQRDFVPLVARDQIEAIQKAHDEQNQEQKRLNDEVERLRKLQEKAKNKDDAELKDQLNAAKRLADEFAKRPPVMETAYAVADAKTLDGSTVHIKGEPTREGDFVPRRFLSLFGEPLVDTEKKESGRRDLAEWIVADWNPLTARVMVNRIWQHHFGRGLVPTPNDYGRQGKPPTHPELLDHLASQFRENGWSIKSMHRLIILSRTYQQSVTRSEKAIEVDPTNELLSSYPQRRLDAEAIRDTLLSIGGNLDPAKGDSHPFPPQGTWGFTQHNPFKAVYDSNKRSVYLMTQRIQRHPFLAIFDGADPSTSTATRMTSTTPLQALYFLNDPFVHEQAHRLAERLISHSSVVLDRIRLAYQLLYSREPTTEEVEQAQVFLKRVQDAISEESSQPEEIERKVLQSFIRSLLRANEFVYID